LVCDPTSQPSALPGLPKNENGDDDDNINDMVYYAAMALLGYLQPKQWEWILDPSQRPKNKHHTNNNHNRNNGQGSSGGGVYMSQNCPPRRQNAAKAIHHRILPVDALGKCQIQKKPKQPPSVVNTTTTTTTASILIARSHHFENWQIYRNYKYCLVLENSNPQTYLSEKILWGYLVGCLPIYWGSRNNVFQVFDERPFVFWNARNITKGLEMLWYLEANHSAYSEALNRPILKNGDDTIRRYFSLSDTVGGGYLKRQIRKALGILPFKKQKVQINVISQI
jgi:hypothetical protein